MAKKGKGSGDSVGSASVEVVLDLEALAEQLAEVPQMVEAASKEKQAGSRRARDVASVGKDAAPLAANVEAKVKTKVEGRVSKDIQAAIDADEYQLTIDTASIRRQIEVALQRPFDIIVNAEVRGATAQAAVGITHGAAVTAGAPIRRSPPPEEVTKALTKGTRDALDNVYRNLNELLEASGKPRFGTQSLEPGNQVEKAMELMGRFGDKFGDFLELSTKGPIPKVTGGSMSPKALAEAFGVDPKAPEMRALQSNLMGLTTSGPSGVSSRSADIFFSRLGKWAQENPATPQPAAAPEQVAQAAVRQDRFRTAAEGTATPATDQMAEAIKTLREERGKVPFEALDTSRIRERFPVDRSGARRAAPVDTDPAATARANQQLGTDRANVRRLIPGVAPREINGIKVDIEPFLQALRQGEFAGAFETKEGDIKRFTPTTDEERLRAEELGKSRRRVTVEGAGQVTPLNPTEAFRKALTAAFDENIVEQIFADPQTLNTIRQSARQGSAAKPLVSPQPPQAGMGSGEGQVISSSGQGFEKGYRAAFRLAEVMEEIESVSADIDGLWSKIDKAAGSGKPTDRLEATVRRREDRLAQLEARRTDLAEAALPITGTTPEQARQLAEAERLRNAENQSRVARGVGLSTAEEARNALRSPTLQGKRAREMVEGGQLPDPGMVIQDIFQRFEQRGAAGAEGSTRQQMNAAMREVFDELQGNIPEKGPVAKEFERLRGDIRRSIFGERERVEAPENAASRLAKETRGGLFTEQQKFAEQAVDRAEAGTGRGRRAQILGIERTGASAASGVAETRPVVARPTTSLDIERQQLMPDYEALAGAFAEAENRKQAQRISRRTGPGRLSEAQPIEDILRSPAVRGPGGRTVSSGFTAPVREAVETETDVGMRVRQIREIQASADKLLEQVARGSDDINEQRSAVEASGFGKAAKAEALQVLETRTAAMARTANTKAGRDPITGDAAREKFAAAGGIQAGGPGEPPFKGYNARRGGDEQPPGGGGFGGEVTGPIHVIVDNVPLRVAWEGSMPSYGEQTRPRRGQPTGEGTEAGSAAPASPARRELRRKSIRARDVGTTADAGRIYTFDPETEDFPSGTGERGAFHAGGRVSPDAIRSANAREALASRERAASPVEANFLSALQQANDPRRETAAQRRREAEIRAARRQARVEDPVGFARERDLADTSLADIRGQNRAIQRRVPRRGFGASVTDLITSIVGRGPLEAQLEAADRAQREVNEINQAAEKRSGLVTQRRGVLQQAREQPLGSERRLGLLEQARELRVAANAQTEIIKTSTKVFDENAKIVRKNTAAAFGAAAVGSIGSIGVGAVTFGLGSAIVAPIITAIATGISEGLGPSLERATGFGVTTNRITRQASDEIRARGGDTGAVAGIAARTGISADAFQRVSPLITQRADVEAGNQALREQIDLLHASENLRVQQEKAGKTGQVPGISAGTGGAFGTPLFGIPSTSELLTNELLARPEPIAFQQAAENQVDPNTINPRLTGYAARAQMINGGQSVGQLTEQFDKSADRLRFFNDAAEKGGESLLKLTPATEAQAEASAKLAEDVGLFDLAGKLRSTETQVQGATSGEDIQRFLASVNRGATTPDPRLLLEDTARQRKARLEVQTAQRELRLNTLIPQQEAIALAQRPFSDASAGIEFSKADDPSTRKQINADLKVTQGLYNDINKEIDIGIAAAKDFVTNGADIPGIGENIGGLGAEAGAQFAKSLDRVRSIGKEIASIEIGLQTKQAAFAAQQFSYQIGIAKRSLADAKGLAGQLTDAGKDNLGVLEREQFFLQRRAQALQLELSQRQINFQRAVSGFTAPGLTGEERAARIQQAKIEADFAQKQLNIQKELFGLQGRSFQITASRQVTDLTGQLALLEKGREITLNTASAEKRIRALTAIQEKENKKVAALYEAAVERTNDIIQLTGELAAATGKDMAELAKDVLAAYRTLLLGMTNTFVSGLMNRPGETANDGRTYSGRHAGGNVMRGSTYEVNEQGEEFFTPGENGMVTPQSVIQQVTPMNGMSSQQAAPITILVTGNRFNTEEEMKKLEARITDAVQRAQSRQLSLLGGRSY